MHHLWVVKREVVVVDLMIKILPKITISPLHSLKSFSTRTVIGLLATVQNFFWSMLLIGSNSKFAELIQVSIPQFWGKKRIKSGPWCISRVIVGVGVGVGVEVGVGEGVAMGVGVKTTGVLWVRLVNWVKRKISKVIRIIITTKAMAATIITLTQLLSIFIKSSTKEIKWS